MDKDPETFRKLRNKVNGLNNRLRSSFNFLKEKGRIVMTQVHGGNPLNNSLAFLQKNSY
jgi:hypothetical protein